MWVQNFDDDKEADEIPIDAIMRKLDTDFFSGRWDKVTDRQRDLLGIIARLSNASAEFTVQDVVDYQDTNKIDKAFSASHINQMLGSLADAGLIYKNRHGKYSFAVPLLAEFIRRQPANTGEPPTVGA